MLVGSSLRFLFEIETKEEILDKVKSGDISDVSK